MLKIKEFLLSPNNRQQIKTVVIGMAVLVATFNATLLTGWITSLKATPEEITPPVIIVEHQDDFLKASADQEIENWQYVGPTRHSTCDETIFDNFLGFGQTFKQGNRARLDFYKDNNKYYCFRAINEQGTSGFKSYPVTGLDRPIIIFKQTKDELTASLSIQADDNDYDASGWQYTFLSNKQSACSERSFSSLSNPTIFSSNTATLTTSQEDVYYCFRLLTIDGDYVYQIKIIGGGENTPAIINPLQTADKLYLLADQEVKDWIVVVQEESETCDNENFENDGDNHFSQKETAIINLDSRASQADSYCIRAQNKAGIYSYKKQILEKTDFSITIEADLATTNPTLRGSTDSAGGVWQIAAVENLNNCRQEEFDDLTTISYQNNLPIKYPENIQKTYCWQISENSNKAYAIYSIPAGDKLIATYRVNDQITGHSLYPDLSNWQYVSRPVSTGIKNLKEHCSEADFDIDPKDIDLPVITFVQVEQYCFRASNEKDDYHYGFWFTADLKLNKPPTEDALVILADQLNLTDLGKSIFYRSKPEFHDTASEIEAVCGFKTRTSCYSNENGHIHILQTDNLGERLKDLKRDIAQAARWNYLSTEQRLIQDLELSVIYRQNKTFLDETLPANFYDSQFYEEELLNSFHDFLMSHETEINLGQWGQSWWNYRRLFFD